jgi:hypothetical protein
MSIDLNKLPRHGLRFGVLHGLVIAYKAARYVYFSGATRQKIGSAISHLRLAGWPLKDEWMGDVNPQHVIGIRLGQAGSARKVSLPRSLPRAKVYVLEAKEMDALLKTMDVNGVKEEIGFSRWGVLEKIGLVETAST